MGESKRNSHCDSRPSRSLYLLSEFPAGFVPPGCGYGTKRPGVALRLRRRWAATGALRLRLWPRREYTSLVVSGSLAFSDGGSDTKRTN